MISFPRIAPSSSSVRQSRPDVVEVRFGDGRIQRAKRGIVRHEWRLVFADRPSRQITDIDLFLTERGGVEAFLWAPPESRSAVFICQSWDVMPLNGELASLHARFSPA